METAPLSTKTGKQEVEAILEHYSALTGKGTVEDGSKGDENNATILKEEVSFYIVTKKITEIDKVISF